MTFDELFAQVCEARQREQRISYRALMKRFELSDDDIEDLKDERIHAKKLAIDEENRLVVWVGDKASAPTHPSSIEPAREPVSYTPPHLAENILTSRSAMEGERKQVTVLFCDLANSTAIAERIGPEHMHTLLNRFFELALHEVHRYEGTIQKHIAKAETCFHKALEISRHQQAESWELRAATSLARLWQSQAKHQEAYDVLEPVYGWFTEGFDTADLKDAKALLDDLS